MSLTNANLAMGVGGGSVPLDLNQVAAPMTHSHHSHGHSHSSGPEGCQSGCCGPSSSPNWNSVMSGKGNAQFRGELSGTQCLAIDVGEDKIAAAVWSEKDFTVSILRQATSASVGVSKEGNIMLREYIEAPSLKKFKDLHGVTYGISSEGKSSSKQSQSSDLLYPTRFLGKEESPSAPLINVLREPTLTCSKRALELPLINSSSSEKEDTLSLLPEELVSLQISHLAMKARESADGTAATNSKKKSKVDKGVTLVVPGYFGQRERNAAREASRLAGMDLQRMYSRGLCAVGASLLGSSAKRIHSNLQMWSRLNPSKNGVERNPLILYIHVNKHGLEVSVIECQLPMEKVGAASTKSKLKEMNSMEYDRLVCLSSGGFGGEIEGVSGKPVMKHNDDQFAVARPKAEDYKDADYSSSLAKHLAKLVSKQLCVAGRLPEDVSMILHSGVGSPQSVFSSLATDSNLHCLCRLPLLPVPDEDAAKGGSILTAAELDSSKQYIDIDDEHSVLVHLLSIAEDVVSVPIGVLLVDSQQKEDEIAKSTDANGVVTCNVQTIYPAGTVIRKIDVGPVRNLVEFPQAEPLSLKDGKVNFFGSHKYEHKDAGFPKILLLQGEASQHHRDSDNEGELMWRPITDVAFPLLADNGKNLLKSVRKVASKEGTQARTTLLSKEKTFSESLLSCKVNFKLQESSGLLSVENIQGPKVSEVTSKKSQIAKIFCAVIFIVLLVLSYQGYGVYLTQQEHQRDVEWLTSFYEQHAPQKLQDPNMVENTLARYKGKLFVLWRKLEKAYEVKFPPPQRILDNSFDL